MYERLTNDDKASYQVLSEALKSVHTKYSGAQTAGKEAIPRQSMEIAGAIGIVFAYLERLLDKAFPGLDEQTRQGQLIDRFVEGLPGEISYQLKLNPRETLEETITRARELFMLEERRKNSLGRPRTVAVVGNAVGSSWSGPSIDPPEKSQA